MSFLAKFYVEVNGASVSDEDSEDGINVLRCTFQFNQPIDPARGVAQGRVRAGRIQVTIESNKETGLIGWILQNGRGDGKIVFNSRELEMSRSKELRFTNATLVDYRETFDAVNSVPMVTHLEIFARKIDFTNLTEGYEIEWQGESSF